MRDNPLNYYWLAGGNKKRDVELQSLSTEFSQQPE